MSGINSSQTADEAERLRSQKKILVEKLKIEVRFKKYKTIVSFKTFTVLQYISLNLI
jgi:hypothetical protein